MSDQADIAEVMIPAPKVALSVDDLADCSRLGQAWRRVDLLGCGRLEPSMQYPHGAGWMTFAPTIHT